MLIRRIAYYLFIVLCWSLCLSSNALALLGEDYTMVTTYYVAPSRWPPEVEARIERFAKAQRELRPQVMQLFKNKANQINKQIWVSQMGAWTFTEAHTIRNAIMQNRSSTRAYQQKNEWVFVYADGSRVFFQYNPLNSRVHTIWAIDKDYLPGDMGVMPQYFWDKVRLYSPQS